MNDPTCIISRIDPEHVCLRRDGAVLNGDNGDCHAGAVEQLRTEQYVEMIEKAVAR